jgi:hypothetical protein
MSRFKVGDRVVIVKSTRGRVGTVTTVIGTSVRLAAHEYRNPGPWSCLPKGTVMYILDLPPASGRRWVSAPGSWLEFYRPDHNEKGEWTDELRELCKSRKVSA